MNTATSSARRKFLINSVTASLGAVLLPSSVLAAPDGYGIEGQVAPELEISHWIDGQGKSTNFSLAEQRGKFVFMECWQAWCPGCHSHGFPGLQKIHAALKDSDYFTAVAIQTTFEGYSSNTIDKLQVMQQRYELPIVMGHDQGNNATHSRPNTMRSYRTGGTPWAILISPEGIVLYNDFSIDAENTIAYLKAEISKLAS